MFNALVRLFQGLPLEDIQEVIAFGGTWDEICHLLTMYDNADHGAVDATTNNGYCYDGTTPIFAEYGTGSGVNRYGG